MASTIPDYDEDVILPTSPLHQYVDEFESFGEDDLNECEEFPVMKNESYIKFVDVKNKFIYFQHLIKESVKFYLSFLYNIFVPCLVPFEYSDLKYVLETAKNSKVLIAEDLTVLSNYESDDESSGELKLSNSSLIQQCFQLFAFALIFFILRSITITNIISNEEIFSFFSGKSYFLYTLLQLFLLLVSVSLYVNIFIITGFILANLLELLLCKMLCSSMKKKLHTTGCIMVMIRKCIRLVQEAELIARGFTSASVPGIVERLELSTGLPIASPQRQYPELRKCVFMWTKKMFMLYKSSTQTLIKNKKIGPVLDFTSQSLAMLDLKEFGHLLKYDVSSDNDLIELLKLTEDFSVSSLKTMYLLLELQVSEFYKYSYLITSFLVSDDGFLSCWKKIISFYQLNMYIKDLQVEDEYMWKNAFETHKYYKSFESQSANEDNTLSVKRSDASHLEINVHNMSLHLKAALKRLADVEELLEAEKTSNDFKSQNSVKKIEEIMKEIKSEVDAYHDCYEKCSNELQNVMKGENRALVLPNFEERLMKQVDTVDVANISRCDSDPIIEDEIFEAIATKSLQDKERFAEDLPPDKQKRDFDVAGKLLNELKNVLILKADEHRVREEKAMAKKGNQGESLPDVNSPEQPVSCSESNMPVVESSREILNPPEQLLQNLKNHKTLVRSRARDGSSSESDSDEKSQSNRTPDTKNSFSAAIAALALQRQKNLGIVQDICFSDSNESDDEIISN